MNIQVQIIRPLTSGGNGDLYIGRRNDNGELVVIKYLREYQSTHARQAFAREVRVLARGLPGLVQMLAANINADVPFYVMPYVTGGSLSTHAGRLTDNQLLTVAAEVGFTLASLHSAHIAHGDIKPDNVLVTHDGRLKVADPLGNGVGCTVLFSQHHGGTPGYWAPEVSAGAEISCAGDVYSYGALLYELLTGRKPQDGQRLATFLGGYAPKIEEIIDACCQVMPDARPSIQEVLRIVRGERWVDIQAARKQNREFWTATACVIGAVLVGAALKADA